jgi:hypothetical protein
MSLGLIRLGELQRIMGEANVRHLRKCASRYESFVWKKSANQVGQIVGLSATAPLRCATSNDHRVRATGLRINTSKNWSGGSSLCGASRLSPKPRHCI